VPAGADRQANTQEIGNIMAEITAAMVKALREETGLGMMDCKKALAETGGDASAAKDLLRKKGLATAERKSGRATGEVRVAVHVGPDRTGASMVQVLCETDFCSRNEVFRAMVQELADMAFQASVGPVAASPAMTQRLQDALAKIGENMRYSRGVNLAGPRVGAYVHHNGKVGVLVAVEGTISDELLADLCMHIAFANPIGITAEDVPADLVAKEKEIALAQAMETGKPREIAEKIVTGKVRKFLETQTLLDQPFVRDDKKKVRDVLGGANVKAFARFAGGADTVVIK